MTNDDVNGKDKCANKGMDDEGVDDEGVDDEGVDDEGVNKCVDKK